MLTKITTLALAAVALTASVPNTATPYTFRTTNRTAVAVRVAMAMHSTVELGSVNLQPEQTYTLEHRGRPDVITARGNGCSASIPVPVPAGHVYRVIVHTVDGKCALYIYVQG